MSLIEIERDIFSEMKLLLDSQPLVTDGVFSEIDYLASPFKVLFVLKEPHSENYFLPWSLLDRVRDGSVKPTWKNIAIWAKAIRLVAGQGHARLNWRDINLVSNEDISEELKNIAVVNLKKVAGGTSTKMNEVQSFLCQRPQYQECFRKQFSLYKPDLVICCGSHVATTLAKVLEIEENWKNTSRDHWYMLSDDRKYFDKATPILNWFHPQLRGRMKWAMPAFALVDVIDELLDSSADL